KVCPMTGTQIPAQCNLTSLQETKRVSRAYRAARGGSRGGGSTPLAQGRRKQPPRRSHTPRGRTWRARGNRLVSLSLLLASSSLLHDHLRKGANGWACFLRL